MTARDPGDIERSLERLVPRSAPPGLRRQVLESADGALKSVALTPRMLAMGAAFLILIVVAGLGDAAVSRAQSKEMMSLLDGHGAVTKPVEDTRDLLAEIAGGTRGLDQLAFERRMLARMEIREEPPADWRKAHERLKGMIDHEDPEEYY